MTQGQRILRVLADGRWHSTSNIHRQAGNMIVHSRISELRAQGHRIEHRHVPGKRGACAHQYRWLEIPDEWRPIAPAWVAPKIPRSPETRYRIYTQAFGGPVCIATAATAEDLGVALVTMGREGQFDGVLVGVMDAPIEGVPGTWLVKPWREGDA